MRPVAILVLVGCVLAIDCTTAAASQRTVRTLSSGGESRSYIVYRPTTVSSAHPPLVIVLHGGTATGASIESLTGFDAVAGANGFELAYPNSDVDPSTGVATWRVGCCDTWLNSATDVNFISAMIGSLASTDGIDRSRVYVVGFSIGAAMAYRLACQLSSQVAAIGSVGGYEYLSTPCAPDRPVSVYEIHGTADYWGGSCGGRSVTNAGCAFGQSGYEPSVVETDLQWRALDDCGPTGTTGTASAGKIIQTTWNGCAAGSSVRLDTIAGGTHCYPYVGATNCASYPASQQFWNFFAPHHLSPASAPSGGTPRGPGEQFSPGGPYTYRPYLQPVSTGSAGVGRRCVVPRLRGSSLAGAKRALAAQGCRLGAVKRSTGHRGPVVVVGQGVPAGTRRAPGTRVSVTLAA